MVCGFSSADVGRLRSLRLEPDSVITTKVQNTAVTQLNSGTIDDMLVSFLWKFYTGSVLPDVRLVRATRIKGRDRKVTARVVARLDLLGKKAGRHSCELTSIAGAK
jgi:hypothetical protein